MTIHWLLIAASITLLTMSSPTCGDWAPKTAPVMTRWAVEVTPQSVHGEHPRPQMGRDEWMNLNGVWELGIGADGDEPPLAGPLAEQILVPFPVESALSGVMQRAERLWYRRTFEIPGQWHGQRVLLHFGAVDWEAKVWVNGVPVGTHRGGYDAFSFDITDALRPGGDQQIVVGVWDPTDASTQPRGKQVREPRGIWYTPTTGIWQTVWLEPVSQSYIRSIKLTPDVDASVLRVSLDIERLSRSHSVDVVVFDGDREIARGTGTREFTIPIPDPKLWAPDSPFLYDALITLRSFNDPARIFDRVRSYFGMRKIEIAPDEKGVMRLVLNGAPIFHIGTLDQGFWPDGLYTAPTDEALRYDVQMTKRLGFNTIRKHVKVEPDRWYYHCDQLGLLVWQDMPSGDAYLRPGEPEIERTPESATQFELELTRLVEGLGNHPSIVMWVPFNEGWGQYDTARIVRMVKALDPTRLVNSASGWTDLGVGDVHDVHSYPGPAAPPPEESRALVLGEFGGLGLGVDGHTWATKAWGYRGTADSAELTRRYEQLLRGVRDLRNESGLSAAIYTQITDVETECNGLLTYDRAVMKVDADRIALANAGKLPTLSTVLATAKDAAPVWRHALQAPDEGWESADFDDSAWEVGVAGFGREGTPGAVIRTPWTGNDIWIRRAFPLETVPEGDIRLYVHHDEDAEVYVNGVLAARLEGYTTTYEEVEMSAEARATLRPGRNVIAIHCRQTSGGQYIDAGLVRLVPYAETPDPDED